MGASLRCLFRILHLDGDRVRCFETHAGREDVHVAVVDHASLRQERDRPEPLLRASDARRSAWTICKYERRKINKAEKSAAMRKTSAIRLRINMDENRCKGNEPP